ncbi:MAG: hypothetical protein LUD50_00620 [Clostridia bacterium]|nr:hypothetical protein [Clostridia bacterium]
MGLYKRCMAREQQGPLKGTIMEPQGSTWNSTRIYVRAARPPPENDKRVTGDCMELYRGCMEKGPQVNHKGYMMRALLCYMWMGSDVALVCHEVVYGRD